MSGYRAGCQTVGVHIRLESEEPKPRWHVLQMAADRMELSRYNRRWPRQQEQVQASVFFRTARKHAPAGADIFGGTEREVVCERSKRHAASWCMQLRQHAKPAGVDATTECVAQSQCLYRVKLEGVVSGLAGT